MTTLHAVTTATRLVGFDPDRLDITNWPAVVDALAALYEAAGGRRGTATIDALELTAALTRRHHGSSAASDGPLANLGRVARAAVADPALPTGAQAERVVLDVVRVIAHTVAIHAAGPVQPWLRAVEHAAAAQRDPHANPAVAEALVDWQVAIGRAAFVPHPTVLTLVCAGQQRLARSIADSTVAAVLSGALTHGQAAVLDEATTAALGYWTEAHHYWRSKIDARIPLGQVAPTLASLTRSRQSLNAALDGSQDPTQALRTLLAADPAALAVRVITTAQHGRPKRIRVINAVTVAQLTALAQLRLTPLASAAAPDRGEPAPEVAASAPEARRAKVSVPVALVPERAAGYTSDEEIRDRCRRRDLGVLTGDVDRSGRLTLP